MFAYQPRIRADYLRGLLSFRGRKHVGIRPTTGGVGAVVRKTAANYTAQATAGMTPNPYQSP